MEESTNSLPGRLGVGGPDAQRLKGNLCFSPRILKTLCRKLQLSDDFDYRLLARLTPGYVGADLMALCREAAMNAVNRVLIAPGGCPSNSGQTDDDGDDEGAENRPADSNPGAQAQSEQQRPQVRPPRNECFVSTSQTSGSSSCGHDERAPVYPPGRLR